MITGRRIRPSRRSLANARRASRREPTSDNVTDTNSNPTHNRDSIVYCARNSTATRNPIAIRPLTTKRRNSSPNRDTARARNKWFAPIINTQTGIMNAANQISSRSVVSSTGRTICWMTVATV